VLLILVRLPSGLQYGALLHVGGINVHTNVVGVSDCSRKSGASGVNLWSETVYDAHFARKEPQSEAKERAALQQRVSTRGS
jgi:hypothetical protein